MLVQHIEKHLVSYLRHGWQGLAEIASLSLSSICASSLKYVWSSGSSVLDAALERSNCFIFCHLASPGF